jgi:hypothetical protein
MKSSLDQGEFAGAPPYLVSNWNVALGSGGVLPNLMDANGNPTDASVLWEATRFTDSPDDQVMFTDSNKELMSGYLDQPDDTSAQWPTFIQITNIPASISDNYDVVIYTLTTAPNAFGQYSVNGGDPKYVVAGGNDTYNGPDFVEAIGDDPTFVSMSDFGNYVVFQGLSGNTVTITATNASGGRAPVNGVQIARTQ